MNSTMGTASAKNLPAPAGVSPKAAACVSQGIRIKGEISGSEDLFVDGQIDGRITCVNSTVTLGPNATVKADVTAREVIVRGRVDGKLMGTERIQVWRTARVQGDLKADRISIEEGAELHGMLEAGKPPLSAPERASHEGSRKTEANKPKDTGKAEDKPASGAAVAGAD
ncbi:MAG: polymer-forming cytoskeletal protein [Candidatus Acidiferrales bacterium]